MAVPVIVGMWFTVTPLAFSLKPLGRASA